MGAIEDGGAGPAYSQHNTNILMYCFGEHRRCGMLRTGCGVSQAATYSSTGVCLVSTCSSGYKPSKDQKKCESEHTSDHATHNKFNDVVNLLRTGCGVSQAVTYSSTGVCLVSTCSAGYKPSKDQKQCESECNRRYRRRGSVSASHRSIFNALFK